MTTSLFFNELLKFIQKNNEALQKKIQQGDLVASYLIRAEKHIYRLETNDTPEGRLKDILIKALIAGIDFDSNTDEIETLSVILAAKHTEKERLELINK